MKRILFAAALAVLTGVGAGAQQMDVREIGDMKVAKFQKKNAKGGQKVAAIRPSADAATETDRALMAQIAAGGMKQLMVSQAVLAKATDPKVRMLAQSEVEEQTGVSNKLKEIASAKGVTLPTTPDAETQALLSQVSGLTGAQLDAFYLRESGYKGHQQLQATMATVGTTANERALRQLAAATLPVIRMHLEVSEEELENRNISK